MSVCAEFTMLTLKLKKKIAGKPGKIRRVEKAGEEKGLALPDIKMYYKTTIIMMVKYSS